MEAVPAGFLKQGCAIVRGILEPGVVDAARSALQALVDREAEKLLRAGKIGDLLKREPFETRLYRLYERFIDDAQDSIRSELHLAWLYGDFLHPRLLDVVVSILGGEMRLHPNCTARAKLPEREGSRVLYHQDGGYTETVSTGEAGLAVHEMHMVNVWTPLVPARDPAQAVRSAEQWASLSFR